MSTALHQSTDGASNNDAGACLVLATAGHVDHGKTSLVQRLTGTNTDTLEEEKRRGLTINLGFAYHHFTTRHGDAITHHTLGFVDVPGHTDFINNMLAGVGSVDSGLLIVAADDGVVPQTREHLAILRLLGIKLIAMVVTKIDRCDSAGITRLESELDELLAEFDMARAPIFKVCAPSGAGIDELRDHLEARAIDSAKDRKLTQHCNFRYLVDRSFSVTGIGTVVTGSVRSGQAHTGDKVYHTGTCSNCRIKSMRVHEADVTQLQSGNRAALNINIPWQSIHRGDWLMNENVVAPCLRFDARLELLDSSLQVRASTQYHLFIGASHYVANLRWLDETRGLAQLKVNHPVFAHFGDRFIIRDPAATNTLGGGRVIDIHVPRRGRSSEERIEYLVSSDHPPLQAMQKLLTIQEYGVNLDQFLVNRNLEAGYLTEMFDQLKQQGIRFELLKVKFANNRWIMGAEVFSRHQATITQRLAEFHDRFPEQQGIGEARLSKEIAFAGSHLVLNAILARLVDLGAIKLSGTNLHLPDHRAMLSEEEKQFLSSIRPLLESAGKLPPRTRELVEQTGIALGTLEKILKLAARNGHVIQISENRYFLPETVMELATLAEQLASKDTGQEGFTVIKFRDSSGLGRNLCIEILEYFDGVGYTRRDGNQRFLRTAKENIFAQD